MIASIKEIVDVLEQLPAIEGRLEVLVLRNGMYTNNDLQSFIWCSDRLRLLEVDAVERQRNEPDEITRLFSSSVREQLARVFDKCERVEEFLRQRSDQGRRTRSRLIDHGLL